MFKQNVGGVDRAVRLALGSVLLSAGGAVLAGLGGGLLGLLLGAVGFVALATGATGFCPLYVPLGLSTRRRPRCPVALTREARP